MGVFIPRQSGGLVFPATFLGNQDVTISAINTSGGIKSFWDTAQTTPRVPCLYQVSASEILATGTSRPYEDLHYAWNFGDPSGTETFTRPTDGATVNANSDQIGPEAAYCYRTAGTYTITLTCAGAGGNVVAQKTKSVTVAAFTPSATRYCDSNATGANTGLTMADAWTSLTSLTTYLDAGTNPTDLLIRLAKGSNFNTSGIGFGVSERDNYSGIRINTYGTGAKPIIDNPNDIGGFLQKNDIGIWCYSSGTSLFYDMVVEGLNLKKTSSDTQNPVAINCMTRGARGDPNFGGDPSIPVTSRMENVYFLDCDMSVTDDTTTTHHACIGYDGTTSDRQNKGGGVWNCTFTQLDVTTKAGSGISGSPQEWWFMLGCTMFGDSDSDFNHHVYPDCADHELYKWCRFGKSGVTSGRGMSINMNWDWELQRVVTLSPGIVLPASYHVVSECETMGSKFSIDAGSRQNLGGDGTDNQVHFYGLVIERNSIHQHYGSYQMQNPCAREMTIRDNRVFDNASGAMYGPVDDAFFSGSSSDPATWPQAVLKSNIYGNRVLISPGSDNAGFITLNSSSYTQPQQWTRNKVKDARSAGGNGTFWFNISSAITAGSVINRNQLYSINNPTLLVFDNPASTAYTWSAYQATGFDANGSNVDPGWSSSSSQWSDLN